MSEKHMVPVWKKTWTDYLYNDTVQRFVFALFLGLEFIFVVRFGYGLYDVKGPIFAIMAAFTLYYFFDPKLKIELFDFPMLMLVLAFFLMGVYP